MLTGKRSREAIYALLVGLLAASVYLNSLGNGFVYDDFAQIVQNQWLGDFRNIPAFFRTEVWGFHPGLMSNYYRPVMHLLNMVVYHLFGPGPMGFHMANLLLHSANSALVFLLALFIFGEAGLNPRFSGDPVTAALAAGIIFAVHPAHTEAVDWIGGSPDLLMAFFSLCALVFLVKRKSPWLQGLFFLLAMLSKEPAVMLLIAVPLFDIISGRGQHSAKAAPLWKRYAPLAVAIIIYFGLRINALGGLVAFKEPNPPVGGLLPAALSAPFLFARYMAKMLLPAGLNVAYDFHPVLSFSDPRAIEGCAAILIFAAILVFSAYKDKRIFFGLCLLVLPLLPVFYFPALGRVAFGERYLYFPLAGFSLAAGGLFAAAASNSKAKNTVLTAGVLVAALLSIATVYRNPVWKSDLTLWGDAAMKSPGGYVPLVNLGVAEYKAGNIQKAITLYQKAAMLDPSDYEAFFYLGKAYLAAKENVFAEGSFLQATRANPRFAESYYYLGVTFWEEGEPGLAKEAYKAAIARDPLYHEAYNNLGGIYFAEGSYLKAAGAYRMALQPGPEEAAVRFNLALALKKAREKKKAGTFPDADKN